MTVWILASLTICASILLGLLLVLPLWQAVIGAMVLSWVAETLLMLACFGLDLVVRARRSR